jgi:hypothetical protein
MQMGSNMFHPKFLKIASMLPPLLQNPFRILQPQVDMRGEATSGKQLRDETWHPKHESCAHFGNITWVSHVSSFFVL